MRIVSIVMRPTISIRAENETPTISAPYHITRFNAKWRRVDRRRTGSISKSGNPGMKFRDRIALAVMLIIITLITLSLLHITASKNDAANRKHMFSDKLFWAGLRHLHH
jgi:hypothetical protein